MPEPHNDVVLRVVFDPNVLVSGAISNGVSQHLVDLAGSGICRIVACPLSLSELRKVLGRDRFLKWRTRSELDRFVSDVELICDLSPDPVHVPPATRDPNDDYLVALAKATKADLICTGDHDFEDVTDVEIVAPAELLKRITSP